MPQIDSKIRSTAPRFRQIVDYLRDQIKQGGLSDHAALPSERVVADSHNVSRMTARRALEAIEAEGLAYNGGRRGRFVSPKRLKYDISNKVSFAAEVSAAEGDLMIGVVSMVTEPADPKLAEVLAVPVGEPLYKYTRLFRVSGHAVFVETEYVIARRFPGFLDHDLRQSTTKLLEQHYDTLARTGDIVIRMRALQEGEAGLLGLPPYTAVIELEQVVQDAAGVNFCFGRQIWRGEMAEFSAQALVNR